MNESSIERYLTKEIKRLGGLSYKFVSPGNTGVPDRIYILDGRVYFVELKREQGVLSMIQRVQLNRLKANGADVRVVRGIEEAKKFIKEVEGEWNL